MADILFQISVDDIAEVADSLGIPKEQLNDTIITYVQNRLEFAFGNWRLVVEDALRESQIKVSPN